MNSTFTYRRRCRGGLGLRAVWDDIVLCDPSVEEETTAPFRSFVSPARHQQLLLGPGQPEQPPQHPGELDPTARAITCAWKTGPPATEHQGTGLRQPGQPPGPPASTPAPMAVQLSQPGVAGPAQRPRAPRGVAATRPCPKPIAPALLQGPEPAPPGYGFGLR
ncbi:uncharacterized protein ACIBXB_007799 [Morphnus guianensis]